MTTRSIRKHYYVLAVLYIGLAGLLGLTITNARHHSQADKPRVALRAEDGFPQGSVCSPRIIDLLKDEVALGITASEYTGSGNVPDLSGNNLDGTIVSGQHGPAFFLPYDNQQYIWQPGWADETVRTSAANLPSGNETMIWRWDHDQDRSKMINGLANAPTVITIGDDSTGLVGELRFAANGFATWLWSESGQGFQRNATSTAAYPTSGRYRGAMRLDPTTGTTTFWTQPITANWASEPGASPDWTQVGAPVTSGASTLASTTGDIETGSKENVITGQTRQYGGSLYRLTVSGTSLADQIDLYPNRDSVPPYKTMVSATGETWTFRRSNPETTSYAVTVVDRPMFSIGNASAIRTPASPLTDFGTTSFSDILVYRSHASAANPINILDGSAQFHNPNVLGKPGFILGYAAALSGFFATASDGSDVVISPPSATPASGQWHVMTRTVNRETKKMSVWVDGVKTINDVNIASIDNASWGGALTIGGFSDGPGYAGGVMDFSTRISIGRVLSQSEIKALQDDLL